MPQVEYTDGATHFVGMPRHAQTCLILPNYAIGSFGL